MKKKDLYKIVKESLSEILKEQKQKFFKPPASISDLPYEEPKKDTDDSLSILPLNCTGATPSYGTISVYGGAGDPCEPQQITDSFICCSSNNNLSNMASGINPLESTWGYPIQFSTQNGCYPPEGSTIGGVTFPPIENNQFTYAQFNLWYETFGGFDGFWTLGGTSNNGDGIVPIEQTDCQGEAIGCPHPNSQNWVQDSIGCADDNGNLIGGGNDFSCCQFGGCGAVDANPPAINLSPDIPATDPFPIIPANEQMDYWIDNGSCIFPPACTEETVTIDGISYNTLAFVENEYVQNSPNYDENSANPTYVGGGLCQVGLCTDTALQNLTDPLGNPVETGFVIPAGTYNNGNTEVIDDPSDCSITICNDSNYDNYYDPNDPNNWAFGINPNYNIIPNNNLCANFPTLGCTDLNASNYNELAEEDDGSCEYIGCMNPAAENYDQNALEDTDPTLCTFSESYFGCTNPEAFNYNPLSIEDDGSCIPIILGCTDPTADNFIPLIPDDQIDVNTDDGSCEFFGCTNPSADNYDLNATDDDGSCIISGCTNEYSNPIGTVGEFNPNATIDDGSCDFNYCTDPDATNYVCNDVLLGPALCEGGSTINSNLEPNFNPSTGCEFPVQQAGCMDNSTNEEGGNAATNYNQLATVPCNGDNMPCTGEFPDSYATANNLSNPLQTITSNPEGCCCQYIPGCIKPTAVNYNSVATVDDGSCIELVEGCTSPGFTNYNPDANYDDGSCFYEGCMMEVQAGFGQNTEAIHTDYVCFDNTPVTDPISGNTFTVGEWLCNCGANGNAPCTVLSDFDTTGGAFIDNAVGYDSSNPSTELNPLASGYPYTDTNQGNCTQGGLLDVNGCGNDGTPYYQQNQGGGNIVQIELINWVEGATNDSSCQYTACANPTALNYFCVDNPGLCTDDITQFASGCSEDPNDYLDGLTTCLDSMYGMLNLPGDFLQDTNGCEFPETYNCEDKGCIDPGDGTGEYNTLNQCEQTCRICSKVEAESCNGRFTKTFECLYIDDEMGDPDCNTSGLYCIGQEFEINEPSKENPDKLLKNIYRVKNIINQISELPDRNADSAKCKTGDLIPNTEPVRPVCLWCPGYYVGDYPSQAVEGYWILQSPSLGGNNFWSLEEDGYPPVSIPNAFVAAEYTGGNATISNCQSLGDVGGNSVPFMQQENIMAEMNQVQAYCSDLGYSGNEGYSNTPAPAPLEMSIYGTPIQSNGCAMCPVGTGLSSNYPATVLGPGLPDEGISANNAGKVTCQVAENSSNDDPDYCPNSGGSPWFPNQYDNPAIYSGVPVGSDTFGSLVGNITVDSPIAGGYPCPADQMPNCCGYYVHGEQPESLGYVINNGIITNSGHPTALGYIDQCGITPSNLNESKINKLKKIIKNILKDQK